MKRKIISIDEELCDGCGLCAEACHEKAIEIRDGKAKLISESYCDGLGDCLPACPQNAIKIVTREAEPFDEEAVKARIEAHMSGCPGAGSQNLSGKNKEAPQTRCPGTTAQNNPGNNSYSLNQWPVQLGLVHPKADFFHNAKLLIAADCTAFARPQIMQEMLKDRITLIACPKLDHTTPYVEKLSTIFKLHPIREIKIVRMEVPCCGGLEAIVEKAKEITGSEIPTEVVTISIDGVIKKKKGA